MVCKISHISCIEKTSAIIIQNDINVKDNVI